MRGNELEMSRREFMVQSAAVGLTATVASSTADGRASMSAPASHSPRIRSVIRREETLLRFGGNGDNWHMTWGADDRQYLSLCDGFGWPGLPGYDQQNSEFNSRLYAIEGHPPNIKFVYLPGYPDLRQGVTPAGRTGSKCLYYCYATLAVGERIYQFLSTLNPQKRADGSPWPGGRFIGAKLIYSPDNGRTWHNQDGSTPVVWEDWFERSRQNMVFFEESNYAFSLLTALQMGRGYELNRDGFAYLYSPNGAKEGTMNELVLCRMPADRILDRNAYRFFAGLTSNGKARWVEGIEQRAPIHTFPSGWVNSDMLAHSYAWHPSVIYNAPLGVYLMVNWGMGTFPNGLWFGKPSYLGFWISRTPWGPWEQIHEETAWLPANAANARAYQPQIAPKWLSADGKSFWLVWTDFQGGSPAPNDRPDPAFNVVTKSRELPYYAFNAQRVDLIVE